LFGMYGVIFNLLWIHDDLHSISQIRNSCS